MQRNLYALTAFILTGLMALAVWGCKNPDNRQDPTVPPPQKFNPGGPIDPNIPTPFAFPIATVADIAIEGDGDIVILDAGGLELFTPYGVFKRALGGGGLRGADTSNYGVLDTGRGLMALGEGTAFNPAPFYDDAYVTGGVPHIRYNPAWWAGEPDPYYPEICVDIASTSSFDYVNCIPHPIAYHPVTAILYQPVLAPDCVADSDCEWPITNVVPGGDYAILAYHPLAPIIPDFFMIFEGQQDFIVHYDFPVYFAMQNRAAALGVVPACALHNLFIVWDITDMNYMSDRDGMTCSNICDIEIDSLGRLIMAMPNADSVAITDPLQYGQPIVVQEVLGGRQNGMGTLPGEFQGPTAVAIDPRNQNILISDTGNGRVQIFDNDGNFIREFGGADATFVPRAIRVDAFGAIYVANWSPLRNMETDNLRIFNEYGERIQYGTIEGFVFDKQTKMPIDNALVRVQSTFLPLTTLTDGDGKFIFQAVAAGTHDIAAEKYGYYSSSVVVNVAGGKKTLVDIYIQRSQIGPAGYGQVTGTVFTTYLNEPVPGLTAEIVGLGISNQTNGNGEFTLYNVPEGEHSFRLSRNGVIYYERYITVTKGEILDLGLLNLPIPIP